MKTYSSEDPSYLYRFTGTFCCKPFTEHVVAYDVEWAKYKFHHKFPNVMFEDIVISKIGEVII